MPGPIEAASFSNEETVDIVRVADDSKSYVVSNLTLIDSSEQYLKDITEMQ